MSVGALTGDFGVPLSYKMALRKNLCKTYVGKDWGIEYMSFILCERNTERIVKMIVDKKIRIYTHKEDFDKGYVVGVYYVFNKTDGKLVDIYVV